MTTARQKPDQSAMDYQWLLLAKYRGQPIIPAETVCADFFRPLTYKAWKERIADGTIPLPVMRMTPSAKAPLYVSINHLAEYLEDAEKVAAREKRALAS